MIFILYSFMMMLLSLNFMILGLMFILNKKKFFLEWMIYSINFYNIEFIIFIDWMMLIFIGVILFISSMVMIYSKEYMMLEYKKKNFIMILMLFIISMILMIMSPNMISILLGWDGLGLSSYCLIIYYQNMNSFMSGKLTLMTNRIGDIMLLMMMFLMLNLGDWNLLFYEFKNNLFIFMFLVMTMTKSAQFPFSMWLPAAMAAPTPVSSLVHSSTLVTAGIYLLIRFNYIFNLNKMNLIIMFIGLLTMLLSSLNALIEFDIKKIIAFSTLSQLGLMMFMLSFNLINYVFFHLISHAMFKSLLFLCAGMYIHIMNGNQDIRLMGSMNIEFMLLSLYMNISNLSLNGFFFLSGFFSKDLLYEMSLNLNLNMFIYYLMYLCVALTMMYSLRLIYYLNFNMNLNKYLLLNSSSKLMLISISLLFLMSIIFGSLMNWLLFSSLNYSLINLKIKMKLYLMMLMGLMILLLNIINMNFKLLIYKMIKMMSNFFYLSKLISLMSLLNMNNMKFIYNINENLWNEYYEKFMILFLLKKMNNLFINLFINKFMNLNFMIIYIFMIFYLLN